MSEKLRGRIVFTKKRGPHGKGHYMETEESGFCGRDLTPGKVMPEDWNPEEHQDVMCSKCLGWYRILNKAKKGKDDDDQKTKV